MLVAPTLGFLTPLFRTRLVVALATDADSSYRVDKLYAYVVNVIMIPPLVLSLNTRLQSTIAGANTSEHHVI